MTSPSPDPIPSPSTSEPRRDEIIAALQRRQVELTQEDIDGLEYGRDHELRQAFRRMIDPGIMRGADKNTALATLKILLKIGENLMSEPDNIKYQQFKPTNTIIKKNLVDVKGAMEYAVAMGFRADVQDFQPYYVFDPSCSKELRIGAEVVREALTRETEKEERVQKYRKEEKSLKQLQAEQVKLAFQDDRKRRALQDKLARERRNAASSGVPTPAQDLLQSPPSTLAMSSSPDHRPVESSSHDSEPDTD